MSIAFPITLYPDSVVASRRRVQARVESPFSLVSQVFDWGTARWEITITMPELAAADAATFGAWLESLGGIAGTFTFDLSPWVPGLTPDPGVRTFRLASPVNQWDSDRGLLWSGFKIDAIEAL